jgi:hypothetical protein
VNLAGFFHITQRVIAQMVTFVTGEILHIDGGQAAGL